MDSPPPHSIFYPPNDQRGFAGCGCLHKTAAHWGYRDRRCPRFVLVWILRGHGLHTDSTGHHHRIQAGDLIQMPAHQPLSLVHQPNAGWVEIFIDFTPAFAEAIHASGVIDTARSVLHPGIQPRWITDYQRILTLARSGASCDAELLAAAFSLWTDWWAAAHHQAANHSTRAQLETIARLLQQAPADRRPLHALLGLSPAALDRLRRPFLHHYGHAIGQYRIQQRIAAARAELLSPQKSIKEIAALLGYPDSITFCKQFRQHLGMTPLAYRRNFGSGTLGQS